MGVRVCKAHGLMRGGASVCVCVTELRIEHEDGTKFQRGQDRDINRQRETERARASQRDTARRIE